MYYNYVMTHCINTILSKIDVALAGNVSADFAVSDPSVARQSSVCKTRFYNVRLTATRLFTQQARIKNLLKVLLASGLFALLLPALAVADEADATFQLNEPAKADAQSYVAGKVVYVRNIVVAVSADENIRVLAKNSLIYSGERLVTEEESYLQVEFRDESRITVRPSTQLEVSEFYFEESQPDKDVATFRLLQGGFYSETGLIGKRGNPNAYRVDSSVANIGVRGTRYSVYLCAADDQSCQKNAAGERGGTASSGVDGQQAGVSGTVTDGLYVGVTSGAVEVSNSGGTQTLSQGEYVFASDNFSSPIFIEQTPVELSAIEPNLPLNGCSVGY